MADQQPARQRVRVPADPYHVAPGDLLKVIITGVHVDEPVADVFLVEPGGTLPLGPTYGRVKVGGLTLSEAEVAVRDHLKGQFNDPKIQITLGGWQLGAVDTRESGRLSDYLRGSSSSLAEEHRADLSPARSSAEEIDLLREHLRFLQAQFERIDAKFQTGSQGGSQDVRDMTGYEMAMAQADLAQAEGRRDKAIEHLRQAEKFAESALRAVNANYEAGRVTHDLVLQAANNLAESKRRRLRFQDAPAETTPQPQRPFDDGSRSRSETVQKASGSEPSLSISVMKKLVDGSKQQYERLQSLASQKVVSAAKLERAKNEYEVNRARLEQASRALKYNQLLVELAEIEYQEAVEKNKAGAGSVSELEVRKLRIKVDLAKAKLAELAE
jgi:hypothetical protein